MKFKKAIVIGTALLLSILGIFVLSILNKKKEDIEHIKKLETTMVLIAPTTFQPGEIISVDKLVWKEWPIQSVSKQYITKNHKQELKEIEGAVVRYPIFGGEPVSLNNIIKMDGKSILSAAIRPGMRAVSVPYSKLSNTPSFVSPGDVVDVVIPRRAQSKSYAEDLIGQTIIRGVRVLAVDNILQRTSEGKDLPSPRTMTLEVTADQAEDLAASIPEGKIVISMQSVFAGQDVYSDGYPKSEDLRSSSGDNPNRVIALFRGSDRSEVNIK